jgi:hypothetical protein
MRASATSTTSTPATAPQGTSGSPPRSPRSRPSPLAAVAEPPPPIAALGPRRAAVAIAEFVARLTAVPAAPLAGQIRAPRSLTVAHEHKPGVDPAVVDGPVEGGQRVGVLAPAVRFFYGKDPGEASLP